MRLLRRSALSRIVAIGFAAIVAMASASAQEAEVAPEAAKILQAMSDTLAAAKSLSGRVTTLYEEVKPGGISYMRERSVLFFVRRPDGLHVRASSDDGVHTYYWYNGEQLARLVDTGSELQYARIDVPDTLDAMLDHLADAYDVSMPLADLLYADPYRTFSEDLISGADLGQRTVHGRPAHHLSFESSGADFELWIAAEGAPLPLRFAITYVNQPGEPVFLAEFGPWNLAPYLDPGMFAFTPPEGAKEVPFARRQ
jgi:hypothetical protein